MVRFMSGFDSLAKFQTDPVHDSCLNLLREMEAYTEALKELADATDYNNPHQVAELDHNLTIAKNLFDNMKKRLYIDTDTMTEGTENALGTQKPAAQRPSESWLGKAAQNASPQTTQDGGKISHSILLFALGWIVLLILAWFL